MYKKRLVIRQPLIEEKKPRGAGSIADSIAKIPDGKNTFMQWIKLAGAEDARFPSVVEFWEVRLSADERRLAELDTIFERWGIDPSDAIGCAARAASKHAISVTQMLYALHMPEIALQNIKQARKPLGIRDREMAMQTTGILPQRPGVTSNVFVNAQAAAAITRDGGPSGVVPFEDDVMTLSEAIRVGVGKE